MNQEKIGKFISKLRKERNLTQEDLAEKLNISSKSVSRWENGKCMPDISLLIPLSEILDITVNELVNGELTKKDKIKEQSTISTKNTINYANTIIKKEKHKSYFIIILTIIVIIPLILAMIDYHFIKKGDTPIFMLKLTDDKEKVESYIGLGYKMTRKTGKYFFTSDKQDTYVKFGTWFHYHNIYILPTEPNYISLSIPYSNKIEAKRGSYCWSQNNQGNCHDTISPIEMTYTEQLEVSGYEKVNISNLIGTITKIECFRKRANYNDNNEDNYIIDINLEYGEDYIKMPSPTELKDIYIIKITVTSEYGEVWYSFKIKK